MFEYDTLTWGFVGVTVFFLLLGLVLSTLKGPKAAAFAQATPSLVTTIGIFGTFVGIVIGLQAFDVNDIDASVPPLLGGLKTAFWTSVWGMGSALLFRVVQPFVVRGDAASTSDDPLALLQQLVAEAKRSNLALVGAEDGSLLTQLQKVRTELKDTLQDGFQRQIASFERFAAQVAENNSKALIEALNEVVRDFNRNLTEQFGENFKQLNHAVGALLEWQENYRRHIEETQAKLEACARSLDASGRALAEVSASASRLPGLASEISTVVAGIATQLKVAGDLSSGIKKLNSELAGALPAINANIDKLTVEFSKKVTDSADAVSKTTERLTTTTDAVQSQMEQSFQQFDRQMQQQLTRTLEVMGNRLASISEKLVDDYTRLANSLGARG